MSHEDIAAWEGFAVALVGAAAVLAGLVFVLFRSTSTGFCRCAAFLGGPAKASSSLSPR
jgi:hypothetical protein